MSASPVNDIALGHGLAGRVVICTGAGGAIGSAVVGALERAGAIVVAADIDAGRAQAALAGGGAGAAVGADLREAEGRQAVLDAALRLGPIRAYVDMAALIRRRSLLGDVTENDWDAQHDTNLRAPFFRSRSVSESMIAAGDGGAIVLFTSQGWWSGGRCGSVVYAAAKGGIVSMTRGLARTLGQYGIRVNAVAPGLVEGPMMRDGTRTEDVDALIAETPLGRIGEPDDIAPAVVFLASDHARFVTGATLNISGGFLMY